MKKLIFTAILMMAFVGASFAKTGEVEVKPIIEVIVKQVIEDDYDTCLRLQFETKVKVLALGYDAGTASALGYRAYFKCMGGVQ